MSGLTLRYVAAPDPSVDPVYHLMDVDRDTGITIQDARAYAGNLSVSIYDEAEGCLYHFGEDCTVASAYETACRVFALLESSGRNIESAHNAFWC